MEWSEAREIIQKNITEGMDINTKRSSFRKVIAVQEEGFIVQIGEKNKGSLEYARKVFSFFKRRWRI